MSQLYNHGSIFHSIINYKNATANDIEALGNIVRQKVYENSGIKLEWEILKIGFSNKGSIS